MVTGVVGKSCSGKDSAVRYLVRNGFHEINVDHLGHEALEVKKEELRAAFGDGIFTDGHVNRKILGSDSDLNCQTVILQKLMIF